MDETERTENGAKRRYRMGARAEAAEETRQRILEAARELFMAATFFDDVSLEQIAERAGVALKTVQRRFQSKDELVLACARTETDERTVAPGDMASIVGVLADRYEAMMDVSLRYLALEPRVPAVAALLDDARRGHWKWLETAFAPHLPAQAGPLRRRRVAELFVATEIYTWHSLRRRFELERDVAEDALRETLEALVARWNAEAEPQPALAAGAQGPSHD
ncbi:MAG TPA: helix-turn-helix domain-containing protein [Polyangiaceae bacterium]|nr:helix-turn-helix domain-containing protein [Polyangiaceae bacterium]